MFNRSRDNIRIKTPSEIDGIRRASRLAAETLAYACSLCVPGAVSRDVDRKIEAFMRDHNARPATKGYRVGDKVYQHSSCLSPNNVICHGVPGDWRMDAGSIVGVDVTVVLDGFFGDTCATVPVGDISDDARRLLLVALESCKRGIHSVKGGARLGDIGHAIQTYAEGMGCSVVREFVGHGTGLQFHEAPQVAHYGRAGVGSRIRAGMTFTVEPMINAGDFEAKTLADGWTAVTVDGSLSAQFEHTLLVTDKGFEILTLPAGVGPGEGVWATPGGVAV
jgi:methionyl aminopeptidase